MSMHEWGTAKSRYTEELSNKQERVVLSSDPTKVSVPNQEKKAIAKKIYKNEEHFLGSDESSLDCSNDSIKPEIP